MAEELPRIDFDGAWNQTGPTSGYGEQRISIGQAYPNLTDIHVRAGCQGGNVGLDAAIRMATAILTVAKKLAPMAPKFVFVIIDRTTDKEYLRPGQEVKLYRNSFSIGPDGPYAFSRFDVSVRPYLQSTISPDSIDFGRLAVDLDQKWRQSLGDLARAGLATSSVEYFKAILDSLNGKSIRDRTGA